MKVRCQILRRSSAGRLAKPVGAGLGADMKKSSPESNHTFRADLEVAES